jgi:hypothetical protein
VGHRARFSNLQKGCFRRRAGCFENRNQLPGRRAVLFEHPKLLPDGRAAHFGNGKLSPGGQTGLLRIHTGAEGRRSWWKWPPCDLGPPQIRFSRRPVHLKSTLFPGGTTHHAGIKEHPTNPLKGPMHPRQYPGGISACSRLVERGTSDTTGTNPVHLPISMSCLRSIRNSRSEIRNSHETSPGRRTAHKLITANSSATQTSEIPNPLVSRDH